MFNLRVKRLRNRKMFRTVWLLGESILLYFYTWLFRDQYRPGEFLINKWSEPIFFSKIHLEKQLSTSHPQSLKANHEIWKFAVTYFSSIIKTFKYHFHIKRIWGFFYHLVIWNNFWKNKLNILIYMYYTWFIKTIIRFWAKTCCDTHF